QLALTVVSLMIDRSWTRGHRFTLAHQERGAAGATTYVHVRDGKPLSVSGETPLGPVATTVVCPPESLLALLGGASPADTVVRGDPRPVHLVQDWVNRAQSG